MGWRSAAPMTHGSAAPRQDRQRPPEGVLSKARLALAFCRRWRAGSSRSNQTLGTRQAMSQKGAGPRGGLPDVLPFFNPLPHWASSNDPRWPWRPFDHARCIADKFVTRLSKSQMGRFDALAARFRKVLLLARPSRPPATAIRRIPSVPR
jgi:hypothetical protein